ncbi:MAG: type II and III secretion system protein family protein [Pirellulales bacterium]
MNIYHFGRILAPRLFVSALAVLAGFPAGVSGQQPGSQSIVYKVESASQTLTMSVNSSRILTLDKKIPQAQVGNPDILELTALSPNQVQISAKKPGVTQVNLWDEDQQIHLIDVVILGDVKALELLLKQEFPEATLKVIPLPGWASGGSGGTKTSTAVQVQGDSGQAQGSRTSSTEPSNAGAGGVLITGYVDRQDHVDQIILIAQQYFQNVINGMTIGGVQQVLLHVKVMEVSRTKLRRLGFDFSAISSSGFVASGVSGILANVGTLGGGATGAENFAFSVIDGTSDFLGVFQALRQNNMLKILAEPTLVTVSGRPAQFNVGGEIPYPSQAATALQAPTVAWKKTGTVVDFVPIVLGNGTIRLEVRPLVRELDETRSFPLGQGLVAPAFIVRTADTGVEMRAGQTLAIAGLISNRVETEIKGLPWVADLPWVGAAFRRVQEKNNEIELVILVTPELVEAMDPNEVPCGGPGAETTSPSDVELYWKSYVEVPACGSDCNCDKCSENRAAWSDDSVARSQPGGQRVQPVAGSSPRTRGEVRITDGAPQKGTAAPGSGAAGAAGGTRPNQNGAGAAASSTRTPSARGAVRSPPNRYDPTAPRDERVSRRPSEASGAPGLIGGSGYDVLD